MEHCLITPDRSRVKCIDGEYVEDPILPRISEFEGTTDFLIGGRQYTFTFAPNASTDFDRISHPCFDGREASDNPPLHIEIVQRGERKILNKQEYCEFMERFAARAGFVPFPTRRVHCVRNGSVWNT